MIQRMLNKMFQGARSGEHASEILATGAEEKLYYASRDLRKAEPQLRERLAKVKKKVDTAFVKRNGKKGERHV